MDTVIRVAGEDLLLLPERCAYWPRERMLLVADAHWGKAAAFRSRGVPVPRGTTSDGLRRLDAAIARLGPRHIAFLGDLLHAREGRAARTLETVREWRGRHAALRMTLVRGNHDRGAGDPPAELDIACTDEPMDVPPFALRHHPQAVAARYVLAGHTHPAVRLHGMGDQRRRLACFLFGEHVGVLPSFGDFTGSADVFPRREDRVFVIAADAVVEVATGPM